MTTVAGALGIFKSAADCPTVKSLVYTSDSFAFLLPKPNKIINVTVDMYNEDSVRIAQSTDKAGIGRIREEAWWQDGAMGMHVYAAAKVAADKAIWQFINENKPAFQVATVVPNINFGAVVGDLPLTSTGTCIPKLLTGTATKADLLFPAMHFVNVRDCAKVHVAALLDGQADRKRLFAMTGPFNWNDVLEILRRERPDGKIAADMDGLGKDSTVWLTAEAEELLRRWFGHTWMGLEESVKENIDGC